MTRCTALERDHDILRMFTKIYYKLRYLLGFLKVGTYYITQNIIRYEHFLIAQNTNYLTSFY